MKCKTCGTEFDEGVFCPECGTKCEGSELLDENAVQEALAIEREKVKTAVAEEAKKRIEAEKENIRKVVEQETRDMAVKEAKEAASKMVELENDAIKQEAINDVISNGLNFFFILSSLGALYYIINYQLV